jgi:hypothetical protein
MKYKMDYKDGRNLSKNFANTFKKLKKYSIFFFWLLPLILGLYFVAFILLLFRALFYVTVDADIEHEHQTDENLPKIHFFWVLMIRSFFTAALNFYIYTIGAVYDIFRIVMTFDASDTFFIK